MKKPKKEKTVRCPSDLPSPDSREMQIAVARFGVIAPLLDGTFPDPSMAAYARRRAEDPVIMPDGKAEYFTPKAFLHWKYDYQHAGGIAGLIPKSRCDKGCSRVLSDEAQAEIARLHEEFPKMSACQIRDRLKAEELIENSVSHSSVQRFLRNLKETEDTPDVPSMERKAFEAEAPGILWQADSAYFPHVMYEGRQLRTYLMIILDDCSRLIVGAQIVLKDNASNFQRLLKNAMKTYGIPTKLLTDNGGPYANDQLSAICASVGTVLIHAKPRTPQTKGKVERAIRTCREQFLATLDMTTVRDLEHFNELLRDWVMKYNDTVHSTTKQTPRERFLKSDRPVRRTRTPEDIDLCFFNRIKRKVRSDSTIQISSTSWDVPTQFIGQTVEIWFSLDDPDEIFIPFGDEKHWLRPTDRVANGKARRQETAPVINYALEADDNDAD